MIVATCGHVDHGKTLLVHALTGIETDRWEEERRRGLTIDLGFAYANFGAARLGFVDVPGHIKFIDNMLAGVSIIDYGLLVIAADDGPMPQTREHLAILQLLQIDRGAVVITKTDRVDAARVDAVRVEIANLLAGTAFAANPVFAVSSVTGEGVDALARHLEEAAAGVQERPDHGHFRLAVDRAFTIKGAGLVVTGAVFSGRVRVGDDLLLMPHNMTVRVRAVHRQNQVSEDGQAGDRCALNIVAAGLTREAIHRGNWLTANPSPATARADAVITVLAGQKGLRHWTPVHVHTAANHVGARVATLQANRIEPGERGLVQLVLSEPVNLCRGDRLILRDQAARDTIGGGAIVDPFSPTRGRARPERLARLAALSADTMEARFTALLESETLGFDSLAFRHAENLTDAQWREFSGGLPGLAIHGDHVIASTHFDGLADKLCEHLAAWHQRHPQAPGANPDQLHLPKTPLAAPLLDALIAHLVEQQRIVAGTGTYSLPGHAARLDAGDQQLWQKIRPVLAESPTQPPVVHDIAKQLNEPYGAVLKTLTQCARVGLVKRPVQNRFLLPEALAALEQLARRAADEQPDGLFSVRQFRDLAGVGRNLCIEILEYFDRLGLTQRIGDKRKLSARK